jgi:hypothetical protein
MAGEARPGAGPDSVEIRFRLNAGERVVYALLFWRYYRVFALLGLGCMAFAAIPALDTARIFPFWIGLSFLLGFLWLPFVVSLTGQETMLRATDEIMVVARKGPDLPVEWRSFRATRRSAGFLLMEFQTGDVIAAPMRTFGPGQLTAFETIAARGIASATAASSVPSDAGEPLLSYRHQVGIGEFVLMRARHQSALPMAR